MDTGSQQKDGAEPPERSNRSQAALEKNKDPCSECQRKKQGCPGGRPCGRCTKKGRPDDCGPGTTRRQTFPFIHQSGRRDPPVRHSSTRAYGGMSLVPGNPDPVPDGAGNDTQSPDARLSSYLDPGSSLIGDQICTSPVSDEQSLPSPQQPPSAVGAPSLQYSASFTFLPSGYSTYAGQGTVAHQDENPNVYRFEYAHQPDDQAGPSNAIYQVPSTQSPLLQTNAVMGYENFDLYTRYPEIPDYREHDTQVMQSEMYPPLSAEVSFEQPVFGSQELNGLAYLSPNGIDLAAPFNPSSQTDEQSNEMYQYNPAEFPYYGHLMG